MYPRLFNIGSFTLHSYGVVLAIAFLVGLWVASRQARRAGLDRDRATDMGVWLLIAGLLGAKLMLLGVEWRYLANNPKEILPTFLKSGGVFYGGLLAALPVAWWYGRRHQLNGWRTADVFAPGVAIGQAIGRIGCLLAGCCFGRPAQVPWAITFRDPYATRQAGTPTDIGLHPSQAYESLLTFGIFLLLVWLSGRKRFDGQVVLSYLMAYAAGRFGLEYFRGDIARGMLFGGLVSTSQFVAILVFLGALAAWPWAARGGAKPQPEPAPA